MIDKLKKYINKQRQKFKQETEIANGINNLPIDLKTKVDSYTGSNIGKCFTFDEFFSIFSLTTFVWVANYRDICDIEFYHDDEGYAVVLDGKDIKEVFTSSNSVDLLKKIEIDGKPLESIWNELC